MAKVELEKSGFCVRAGFCDSWAITITNDLAAFRYNITNPSPDTVRLED